jgi:hypothetical protein
MFGSKAGGDEVRVWRLEVTERQRRVIAMREEEKRTYGEIGKEIGTGAQRARQIYEGGKRMERWLKDPRWAEFKGFRMRVINLLYENEIMTPEKAKRAYEEGLFKERPGFGKQATREIAVWAGIELRPKRKRECPHCGKAL